MQKKSLLLVLYLASQTGQRSAGNHPTHLTPARCSPC
jgi:hypothetical protein